VLRSMLCNLLTHSDAAVRAEVAKEVRATQQQTQSRAVEEVMSEEECLERESSEFSWELAEPSAQEALVEAVPEEDSLAEEHPAQELPVTPATENALPASPSGRVLACTDLTLGVEAQEDASARGDVTEEFQHIVAEAGAKQAFRAGRVAIPVGLVAPVPACAKVVVVNDGGVPWPATTVLAVVAGEAMGFPQMALGALLPGEAAEVQMDLLLPPKATKDASRSAWALVDAATGRPLGPLIFFEGVWM